MSEEHPIEAWRQIYQYDPVFALHAIESYDHLAKALEAAEAWIISQADKDEEPEHWGIVKRLRAALAKAKGGA
jgi:hypothetical protein